MVTIIGSQIVTGNVEIKAGSDILLVQSNKEVYFSVYGYSVDNPNVVVNPYGNSPLTALVMFETNNYSEVEVTIKGKESNSDIYYKFGKDKYHMIPIYGLYADYENTIIIKSEGIEKVISIKTDVLPEDFEYVENNEMGNFVFLNGNYPYAIDSNGDVRWYLNEHYYGNISLISNSSIIVGSDRYDENGNVVSFYRMSLLGKIYNEYLLEGGYYGYNAVIDDNVVVLSDDVLVMDMQTGEVVETISNDGYDYLDVSDGNLIIGKDGVYYRLNDEELQEISYSSSASNGDFYNGTSNYKISGSERFGTLGETAASDEKVALINYEKVSLIDVISIEREFDRLVITNRSEDMVYLILDKFMDKRVYEVDDVLYVNNTGLSGKYTIYYQAEGVIYKTNYYIEV